jgi:aldose 1-epimerase
MKILKTFTLVFIIAPILTGYQTVMSREPVRQELLGNHNGSEVYLFTLRNSEGNILKVTNYGARIVRIEVPDKNGIRENITTGGVTLETIVQGNPFGGATIGRYANRIANGKFTLDGKEYTLPVNNKPNTLHGGPNGWYSKVWTADINITGSQPSVKFSYVSPDMEEGFPGTIKIEVTYTWSNKNELTIDYSASTDKKSVINLTNHAYFNLHGTGKGYIFDHILTLNASAFTPVNSTLIPTGEIKPVKGTPFDFTTPRAIGDNIGETFENAPFNSYDHNFVLDKKAKIAATVFDPVSGRVMEVITDQPGIQFFSGSGAVWKKSAGESGTSTNTRSSFALETQHFPDSPNQPGFPSTIINPGDKFKSRTIYRFSVKKDK